MLPSGAGGTEGTSPPWQKWLQPDFKGGLGSGVRYVMTEASRSSCQRALLRAYPTGIR